MKLIIVSKNEAGQRLDKLLAKYLNKAPKSFLYKMLRKKNITLNNKKASGNEMTVIHDEIRFFLADDTYDKFTEEKQIVHVDAELDILYEDQHLLLINKPCDLLSQKAKDTDISVNEQMISYLISTGAITADEMKSFKPAVCNRLDRNTSGIIVAGKSLLGLQTMAEVFKDRSLHKYYRCLVKGEVKEGQRIEGYLVKDEKKNQVFVSKSPIKDALPIKTEYKPIASSNGITLLEVLLLTGRSHQIRAHLSSIGHPIIGDSKYGDRKINEIFRARYRLSYQLLHSYRLVMPIIEGEMSYLSKQIFTAPLPKQFAQIVEQELEKYDSEKYDSKKEV